MVGLPKKSILTEEQRQARREQAHHQFSNPEVREAVRQQVRIFWENELAKEEILHQKLLIFHKG